MTQLDNHHIHLRGSKVRPHAVHEAAPNPEETDTPWTAPPPSLSRMATSTPSSLFMRLTNTWRYLTLRCDIDDIVLELLGRFSLEKIYASSGDRESFQHLVISLLSQLKIIFNLQRLTIPPENTHVGWYLGYLISWEVAARSIDFVLQTVVEGREYLWEHRHLRDEHLAEFLLCALRVLALHPRAPTSQRARDRRERFRRIHGALEQVFDSYPGPKSFLLEVCKEVTNQLHSDPDVLALPPRLRRELPTLTAEMYPLAPCLQAEAIATIVPPGGTGNWLTQFLALRDVSLYVIFASIQHAVNRETQDMCLQSSLARSRNAVLTALDRLQTPARLPKVDMVAAFSAAFRIILPDTLDFHRQDTTGPRADDCELDALDALCTRLMERQVVHRVGDRDVAHGISQVIRNILIHDDPGGQYAPARPGLYVLNCPECHLIGASQLRSFGIQPPLDPTGRPEVRLPANPGCPHCGGTVTIAREVSMARQIWDIIEPLRPDVDAINIERHVSNQFQLAPPRSETNGVCLTGRASTLGSAGECHEHGVPVSSRVARAELPSPTTLGDPKPAYTDAVSPLSPTRHHSAMTLRSEPSRHGGSAETPKLGVTEETKSSELLARVESNWLTDQPSPFSSGSIAQKKQGSWGGPGQIHMTRTVPLVTPPPSAKSRSKWRLKFAQTKKGSTPTSGDSSSLSSTAMEAQRLDEISLAPLVSPQKSGGRSKSSRNINVYLSDTSTLGLFWTQFMIHVWDAGASPPALVRAISPESTCILAAVGGVHLAYIIGTRDQKLTLKVVNLVQPAAPVVEYRIPSSLWARSIAIDKQENCVVVGFDNATVRFFNARKVEEPREDRLHAPTHSDCRACPPVDTLSFSSDGLALIAGTRSSKTGLIQLYSWRFPFHSSQELATCRYPVPLHESEDNGISSAIIRPGLDGDESLVCITTWTQSGIPVLIQPRDGHRSEIRSDSTGKHNKLGNRIQCAIFSPSGKELFMVNDKGHVFQVSSLNSNPMDVRRIASTKELTVKSESFAMSVMTLSDEEHVVVAGADCPKAIGWIKKIPVVVKNRNGRLDMAGLTQETAEFSEPAGPPAELPATERMPKELAANCEDQ
ncbi:hypothetical protein VTJ83DRAFT_3021 [Remersonia thermophila]|uniref:Uncharacterized protein n=1 Tax=Remersonia thermophila TaxID=72144 RepID=A0ABR4DCV2_9PEZI